MRKLWKPGRCPIPGFLFLCPRICCTHRGDGSVFLFPANRSAPGTVPVACRKTGSAGLFFFVSGESLRSEAAPVACRKTGGAGAVFCSRRIAPLPELRPSLVGKQGGAGAVFVSGGLFSCRSIGLPMAGVRGCDGIARIAPNGLLSGLNRFVKHCPTALKPVAERGYVMKLLNIFKIFLKYLHNSKHPRIFAVKF